jgi:hypothetical protein
MPRVSTRLVGLFFALVLPCLAAAQTLPSYVGQVVYLCRFILIFITVT